MIADLDETLRQLLIAEIPVKNGEVEIKFDLPKREWSSRLSKPTVNLFLYDVRENNVLRQHQWEQVNNGKRADTLAHLKRTPFRVDCFYMLTTWANDPEDEHRLLTRAMLALFRFPTLPEDRLVGTLRHPTFEIQARLACHDRLTNPAEVWSALDNEMRPSVPYIVTLALDPWKEMEITEPLVRTLTFRSGQIPPPPSETEILDEGRGDLNKYRKRESRPVVQHQVLDETLGDLHWIGGTVYRKADKSVARGTRVAAVGTDLWAETDENGRFVLGPLATGQCTLDAGSFDKPLAQKSVLVPCVEHLFSADLDAVDALDAGQVSTGLGETFQSHNKKLSSDAQVSVRQARSRWTIVDVGQTYFLDIVNQALHVYAVREETYDLYV